MATAQCYSSWGNLHATWAQQIGAELSMGWVDLRVGLGLVVSIFTWLVGSNVKFQNMLVLTHQIFIFMHINIIEIVTVSSIA